MTITIDYNNDRVILELEKQRIEHKIKNRIRDIESLIEDILNMINIENDGIAVELVREDEDTRRTIGEW